MFDCDTEIRRSEGAIIWHLEDEASKIRARTQPVLAPPLLDRSHRHFLWRQHSSHNRSVQLVLSLADISRITLHSQDEDREGSLLVKIFLRDGDRQNSVETVLAVRGFVTMLPR